MKLISARLPMLVFLNLVFSTLVFSSNEKIPDVLLKYNIQTVNIKNSSYMVFNFSNIPHWHTYWKNPGDAGFGPKFNFTSEDGSKIKFSPLEWPSPGRYIEPGDIWAYGYEGEYSFFFELPKNYNGNIKADLSWLICKHICIPGKSSARLELERSVLTNVDIKEKKLILKELSISELDSRINNLPTLVENSSNKIDIILAKEESTPNTLALFYNTSAIETTSINFLQNRNLIFPYPHPYLEFKHEKLYQDKGGAVYAKTLIEWNGMYEDPEIPFPQNNALPESLKLSFDFYDAKNLKNYRINKTFSKLYDATKLNAFLSILKPLELSPKDSSGSEANTPKKSTTEKPHFLELLNFILLAILGGFILNFMPCVLPVISLKIFGLVNQANQNKSQIIKHNLLYTAGVISTFCALALVVVILKLSGQAIGWGFQMQSPTFIASISIFLFLFSLNLFGMYEFITPGGSTLGSIKIEGAKGDFLNGVLATILSTPCSAPFLGTALAFAFTSGPLMIFLIFISVGIGLASPFLLTAAFPSTIKFFPKPGNWMNHFKKFLGLSLIITVFWLVSIFIQLNTDDFSLYLLITLFMIGPIAITIYQKIKRNALILLTAFALTIIGLINIGQSPKVDLKAEIAVSDTINKFGMKWDRWNPDIINEFQGSKKKTFIDFTADWCLTCKVNEKLVINTDEFRSMIKDSGAKLIMGDWTDGNPEMTKWLQQNDMAGVPAYFVIDNQGNLHNLGETVTIEKVKQLLKN